MAPACWLCGSVGVGGRLQKRDNGICPPICLGESCPPVLTLMPDTTFSPCMPLVPFKLLPWCQSSERVSLSKSVCGFFKRNCLEFLQFLPPAHPHWFLHPEDMGTSLLSHGTLEPWTGGLVWGWDSSLLRYPSQIPPHVGLGPACSTSPPLLPVKWMWFL